jgi:hypothetical protein
VKTQKTLEKNMNYEPEDEFDPTPFYEDPSNIEIAEENVRESLFDRDGNPIEISESEFEDLMASELERMLRDQMEAANDRY